MGKKHDNEDFVTITDQESMERMLSNAEIDFESFSREGITQSIRADNGVVFHFNDDGDLESMEIE